MSLFFSMNWFKSKRDLESVIDKNKERIKVLQDELNKPAVLTIPPKALHVAGVDRPYRKVKLVNDVLTIILTDGSVISKSGSLYDDFLAVRSAETEEEVLNVVSNPEGRKQLEKVIENISKLEKICSNIDLLVESGEFEFRDDALYMVGVDRSIPELLIEEFSSIFNNNQYDDVTMTSYYQSLKKFWLKCCLNPNAQSAEDLYTFLSKHQFRIDRHGNFYAYRRVVSIRGETDQAFVDFVSNAYNKVKAVWKKKPDNFRVVKLEDDSLHLEEVKHSVSGTIVGNLDTLYKELATVKGNSYTDAHTGSFDYKVGKSVSMPRHMGDDDNQISCSKGSK